nr:MAG TPA: hypothetical protein [Caudoviricetes sp.]
MEDPVLRTLVVVLVVDNPGIVNTSPGQIQCPLLELFFPCAFAVDSIRSAFAL